VHVRINVSFEKNFEKGIIIRIKDFVY